MPFTLFGHLTFFFLIYVIYSDVDSIFTFSFLGSEISLSVPQYESGIPQVIVESIKCIMEFFFYLFIYYLFLFIL